MATYFTSDTHFQHVNIRVYCNRPWATTEEMTEGLINNWNSVVSPGDTVFHIGDFCMGDKNNIPDIKSRLNGSTILVRGNHDLDKHGNLLKQISVAGFTAICDELYVMVDGIRLYLRHEPDMNFKPNEKVDYHLCGHVHQSWTRVGPIINVGVDVNDYRPQTLQQLCSKPEVRGNSHRGY